MKIQVAHKITQPVSHHSSPHVIERVKVVLEYVQEPKHKGDSSKVEVTGYYIFERSETKWHVVEEERWMSALEAEDMLSRYDETGEIPKDFPRAIEGMILLVKKLPRSEKGKRLRLTQDWINQYEKICERKMYNQVY